LDPCVYDVFDSESALELNPEAVTLTPGAFCISVQQTKSMVFERRNPVKTKIVIDNKIIAQINLFNYLGNMISYEKELDIDNKLHNNLKITGILNNVLGHKNLLRKQE